jgi:hypothetical protein
MGSKRYLFFVEVDVVGAVFCFLRRIDKSSPKLYICEIRRNIKYKDKGNYEESKTYCYCSVAFVCYQS